jgi:transcriptional regulator with XRE-family HTH domain
VDLSRRIRHLRYGKGWGTDELAAHANISRTALIQIENGRTRNPQAGTLRKLSRALGVPLERLLETEPDAVDDAAVPRASGLPTTTASTVVPGRFPSSERALSICVIDRARSQPVNPRTRNPVELGSGALPEKTLYDAKQRAT